MIRKQSSPLSLPSQLRRIKVVSDHFELMKSKARERLFVRRFETPEFTHHGPGPRRGERVVASYNVHKCVGTDRQFDPARIAAVIAEMEADVVAIQEADRRFGRRSGLLDIDALKRRAGLTLVDVSEYHDGHGWHGNALFLKAGKVDRIRRLDLPGAEPRGALVADLELPEGPLRIVAAHLGLLRRSRMEQVREIVRTLEEQPEVPTLLVGDLNEWRLGRRSSLHGLSTLFGPSPSALSSFPSYFPFAALDRVFGSPGLIRAMEVHASPLAQVASDHLPLKATIDIGSALRQMERAAAPLAAAG